MNVIDRFAIAGVQKHYFEDANTEHRRTPVALTVPCYQHLDQLASYCPGGDLPRFGYSPPVPASMMTFSDHIHTSVPGVTVPLLATGQDHFHPSTISSGTTGFPPPVLYMDHSTEQYPNSMPSNTPWIELPRLERQSDRSGSLSYPSPTSPSEGNSAQRHSLVSSSQSQNHGRNVARECLDAWKLLLLNAVIVTGSECFVPQTLYKPHTEADQERYIEQVTLSSPIIFVTEGPYEWGIPLEDVLKGNTKRLPDRDKLVLQDCGPSVSIRINWPGYPSFKRQIPSRDFRKTKGPTTKGKLAKYLAITTCRFIEKMSTKAIEDDVDTKWRVGSQHIKMKDLILVSLHQVSKGSWQPQFRMR
ncbi:hypothetical protein BS17DRAFT_768677 [Gyrodon lividus]|nr:hypothetical protein BS17DRAFT_768677 [Gyrodon lividus]